MVEGPLIISFAVGRSKSSTLIVIAVAPTACLPVVKEWHSVTAVELPRGKQPWLRMPCNKPQTGLKVAKSFSLPSLWTAQWGSNMTINPPCEEMMSRTPAVECDYAPRSRHIIPNLQGSIDARRGIHPPGSRTSIRHGNMRHAV